MCDLYDPAVHTPRNPRATKTYIDTSASRRRTVWCLKCGCPDHATVDCSKESPAIVVPEKEEDKARMQGFCTYCGYPGRGIEQCMRRGMEVGNQNTGEIRTMKDEITAIKKSLEKVDVMQNTVNRLDAQMMKLIQWQNEVVDPGLRKADKTAKTLRRMDSKVNHLTGWQVTAQRAIEGAVTQTAFDKWPLEEYETTKSLA